MCCNTILLCFCQDYWYTYSVTANELSMEDTTKHEVQTPAAAPETPVAAPEVKTEPAAEEKTA